MFIAVDLKVVEGLASAVAKAAGDDDDRLLGCLVRLWHRCWADEVDHLTKAELAGVFGHQKLEPILAALLAFGFLVATEDSYRVKGAKRYLRLKESRRRGAAKTNALKRRSKAFGSDAQAPLNDALPPSHRTPNTETTTKASAPRKKRESPADPRHAPLVKALKDFAPDKCFLSPQSSGRDAAAVKELLVMGEPLEVLERWRRALGREGFPTVRTLPELARHWAHFAADKASVRPIQPSSQWKPEDSEGPIRGEEIIL